MPEKLDWQRKHFVGAGTKDGLSDCDVPRPALNGVIWGDGSQLPSTPSQCAVALKLLLLKRFMETLTMSIFLNS